MSDSWKTTWKIIFKQYLSLVWLHQPFRAVVRNFLSPVTLSWYEKRNCLKFLMIPRLKGFLPPDSWLNFFDPKPGCFWWVDMFWWFLICRIKAIYIYIYIWFYMYILNYIGVSKNRMKSSHWNLSNEILLWIGIFEDNHNIIPIEIPGNLENIIDTIPGFGKHVETWTCSIHILMFIDEINIHLGQHGLIFSSVS